MVRVDAAGVDAAVAVAGRAVAAGRADAVALGRADADAVEPVAAGRADAAAGVEAALDVVENRVDAVGDCVVVRGDVVV